MGILTDELKELELGSCFELVSSPESKQCKAAALRYGFVHLSRSDVESPSPRRAHSAEPRGSSEVEDIAFARYVATFHFSSRRTSTASNATEGGLKTPTGARQKLAELASPYLTFGVPPERPEPLQLDEQSEGSCLPPVDANAAVTVAAELVPPPCAADELPSAEELKAPSPPGSPTRMRADAPTFVPQTMRCVPLSTMPPSSPSKHLEAGARVPPPPPPSPPPLVPSSSQPTSFNDSPPRGHPGKVRSWRSQQPAPVKGFRRSSGSASASSWRGCDETIPPPPEAPKLTHALLGRVNKRVQARRYSDFHASERDSTALETASHGSCSNSTTAPPSVDEVTLPQPPPPDTPPKSETWPFFSCGYQPSDRRRSWADMEDRPGSPERDASLFSELVIGKDEAREHAAGAEAAKPSSGANRKKTLATSKMSARNMIWRPKINSP